MDDNIVKKMCSIDWHVILKMRNFRCFYFIGDKSDMKKNHNDGSKMDN